MRRIIIALVLAAGLGPVGTAALGLAPAARADTVAAVQALAEQGDAKAQYALGTMYRDGQGVAQDFAAALDWWRRSAAQGFLDAQLALGNMYAGGTGIPKDPVRAYMWFDIAAAQSGDDWLRGIAASNRDAIAARMTPEEVAKAKGMAADWRAKHGG